MSKLAIVRAFNEASGRALNIAHDLGDWPWHPQEESDEVVDKKHAEQIMLEYKKLGDALQRAFGSMYRN